jgi:hypothetical protein
MTENPDVVESVLAFEDDLALNVCKSSDFALDILPAALEDVEDASAAKAQHKIKDDQVMCTCLPSTALIGDWPVFLPASRHCLSDNVHPQ